MEKYGRVGRDVRAIMFKLTPLVEPVSIDEAFMDLNGTARLHRMSPAKALAGLCRRGRDEPRHHRVDRPFVQQVLAKIASDLDKPRGFAVLGGSDAAAFLAPKPVSLIFGGKMAQQRLARDGLRTIGDLQRAGETELRRLWRGGRAARPPCIRSGRSPGEAEREAKSISPRRPSITTRGVPAAGAAAVAASPRRSPRGSRPASLPARR
jgi:DNA polymerase-4